MLLIETDMCSFETIARLLPDVVPGVRLKHIATDENLKKLGFVDYPPCVFTLDMSRDEFDDIMFALMDIETDAFNTPDGEMPEEDDPYYQKYLKYGWLWDLFFQAKVTEIEV
ncbi:MAG: hypothetical protein IK118_09525 [Clostridia bacterium]|nr:hypothetical protein [Clostridia bacterium]